MKISFDELGNVNVLVNVERAELQMWSDDAGFDSEGQGRKGHLLYYVLDNQIEYYFEEKKICTAGKNDIVFFPAGSRYTSVIKGSGAITRGIGLVFNLTTASGQIVEINSPIQILAHDTGKYYYKKFYNVYLSTIDPCGNTLSGKANFYALLDDLASPKERDKEIKENFPEIFNALHALTYNPEINYSNKQLASFCYMSNSVFLRKFKEYSGGITPFQYRNNLRLTQARELINTTSLTIDEIAHRLEIGRAHV